MPVLTMVDNERPNSRTNNRNNIGEEILTRVIDNHNINHETLRELLKRALNPLDLHTVPSKLQLSDIIVTRNQYNELSLRCEVTYHYLRRN